MNYELQKLLSVPEHLIKTKTEKKFMLPAAMYNLYKVLNKFYKIFFHFFSFSWCSIGSRDFSWIQPFQNLIKYLNPEGPFSF